MAKTKLILLVPTVGKKAGDEIEVDDTDTAERLIESRSARRPGKSDKG